MSEQKELSTQDIMIAKLKFEIYQEVSAKNNMYTTEMKIEEAQKIIDFVFNQKVN